MERRRRGTSEMGKRRHSKRNSRINRQQPRVRRPGSFVGCRSEGEARGGVQLVGPSYHPSRPTDCLEWVIRLGLMSEVEMHTAASASASASLRGLAVKAFLFWDYV